MRWPKAGAAAGGRGRSPSSGRCRASRSTAPPSDQMPPGQMPPGQYAAGSPGQPPPGQYPQGQAPGQPGPGPRLTASAATSACSWSAGWWRRRRAATRPRPAAQDRERHAPAGAQLPGGAAAAQPRGLLGPVPVLQDAAGARRAASSSPARWMPAGSGSPTSRRSAARSWARATARSRTTSSASSPATAAASSTSRRCAGARPATRSPRLWGEEEGEGPRGNPNQFGNLPFATYRTLCVRLCDGYYFPVSFSTLPNHFQRDAELCQSQCAAPAELYYHQNPGGAVEQMVSAGNQQPYTSLKSAWRYRKEFVQGCSCKAAEYQPPAGGDKKAEAPATPAWAGRAARLRRELVPAERHEAQSDRARLPGVRSGCRPRVDEYPRMAHVSSTGPAGLDDRLIAAADRRRRLLQPALPARDVAARADPRRALRGGGGGLRPARLFAGLCVAC